MKFLFSTYLSPIFTAFSIIIFLPFFPSLLCPFEIPTSGPTEGISENLSSDLVFYDPIILHNTNKEKNLMDNTLSKPVKEVKDEDHVS
jgi:hypothetical protein